MPGLHIGKLAPGEIVKDEDMKKDFIELRKTAEQMVCDGFLLTCFLLIFCSCITKIIALDLVMILIVHESFLFSSVYLRH